MKKSIALAFTLLALLVGGCATTTQLTPEDRAKIRHVAVAASFADLSMQKVGTTVFNNVFYKVPDTAGATRASAAAAAEKSFAAAGKETRLLSEAESEIWEQLDLNNWSPGYSFSPQQTQMLSDLHAAGIDSLVLVQGQPTSDQITGTNQRLVSHGLFHRTFLTREDSYAFVSLRVVVLSTADGAQLGRRFDLKYEPMPAIPFAPTLDELEPEVLTHTLNLIDHQLETLIPELLSKIGVT